MSNKPYGAHNESRFSVSLRKKEYQTVRHTQNPYRFSIWTGTRELNIMCASQYIPYTGIVVYIVQCTLCVLHMHEHITNGEMIFCLSASYIRQQSVLIRRSLFSKCKCLLLSVTTDWVIRLCIGGATGLKIDWQPDRSVLRCGEWAAVESHCSDIKRENHQQHREPSERVLVAHTEVRLYTRGTSVYYACECCWCEWFMFIFLFIDFYFFFRLFAFWWPFDCVKSHF